VHKFGCDELTIISWFVSSFVNPSLELNEMLIFDKALLNIFLVEYLLIYKFMCGLYDFCMVCLTEIKLFLV